MYSDIKKIIIMYLSIKKTGIEIVYLSKQKEHDLKYRPCSFYLFYV